MHLKSPEIKTENKTKKVWRRHRCWHVNTVDNQSSSHSSIGQTEWRHLSNTFNYSDPKK